MVSREVIGYAPQLLLAAALVACGGKTDAPQEPPGDDLAVAPDRDDASSGQPTTVRAPDDAAPVAVADDVSTADGVAAFVGTMCERAAAGDDAWVEAHVRLPLRGSGVSNENAGDPLLGAQPFNVAGVAHLEICKPPIAAGDVRDLQADGTRVTATIAVGQFEQRLVFAVDGEHIQMIEDTFVLGEGAAPDNPAKVRDYEVTGYPLEADGNWGGRIEAVLLGELERHPACIRHYVATETSSMSLRVVASKREGADAATARVYASTVAPASLLACLQRQLDAELSSVFRGAAFEVVYLLMISIPVSDDELDPDTPTITIGP